MVSTLRRFGSLDRRSFITGCAACVVASAALVPTLASGHSQPSATLDAALRIRRLEPMPSNANFCAVYYAGDASSRLLDNETKSEVVGDAPHRFGFPVFQSSSSFRPPAFSEGIGEWRYVDTTTLFEEAERNFDDAENRALICIVAAILESEADGRDAVATVKLCSDCVQTVVAVLGIPSTNDPRKATSIDRDVQSVRSIAGAVFVSTPERVNRTVAAIRSLVRSCAEPGWFFGSDISQLRSLFDDRGRVGWIRDLRIPEPVGDSRISSLLGQFITSTLPAPTPSARFVCVARLSPDACLHDLDNAAQALNRSWENTDDRMFCGFYPEAPSQDWMTISVMLLDKGYRNRAEYSEGKSKGSMQ